jgi:small ligand-binding sensory domain FIST
MNASPAPTPRRFAAAISTRARLVHAVTEVVEQVTQQLDGSPDAAIVFVTHDHAASWDSLPAQLARQLGTQNILGCSAVGVIGTGREVENGPGVSLWAARLPDVEITPLSLTFRRTSEGGAIVGWPDPIVADWPSGATLLLLAEPFSFPADYLLQQIHEEHPRTPVIGGMASGASTPGENRLFYGTHTLHAGAVGWMLGPQLQVDTLVSQGCRPIGETLVVTSAEGNLIYELGGKPALEQLRKIFNELPTHEQELARNGLHIGRVVSEYQDQFEMGDFLIRNVMGIDRETGVIAVGDFIRPGQTVQFHLREEKAATAELQHLLAQCPQDPAPQAALLFTCNGRGTNLFSEPDHDARRVAERLGDIPLAGFFAQGEIGPVGGVSFLHGFTASVALFR